MMRWFLAVVLLFVMCTPATADVTDAIGSASGDSVQVGITVTSPGTDQTTSASSRPVIAFGRVQRIGGDGPPNLGDLSNECVVSASPLRLGIVYQFIVHDVAGSVVANFLYCQPVTPGDPNPPPPTLPDPPTVGEAWAEAHLPPATVTLDPSTRGITGLPTRISTTGPTTVTISATVRGYTITGTATLDHYSIAVDGEPSVDTSGRTYTFETKGLHRITIASVWHAHATITGNELTHPVALGDIGSATISTTRTYPVHEIRAVIEQ